MSKIAALLIAIFLGIGTFSGCTVSTNTTEQSLESVADYCLIGYCGCHCNNGTTFSDKCTPLEGIDACKNHCASVCSTYGGEADSCSGRLKCDYVKVCTCISDGSCNDKVSAASC